MHTYENRLRKLSAEESIFFLPPFQVQEVLITLSETVDWGLRMLNVPNFWKHTKGRGVNVAVLDTGIATNHPDLKEAIIEAKDFTGSPIGYSDENGHGTHCAGIISARMNGQGVVGVAPESNLLIGKVLDDDGSGKPINIVQGIDWAVDSGADVISLSFGSNAHFPIIQQAIERAISKNKFVICAAGNDGFHLDSVDYPARYQDVIAVGAIDRSQRVTSYSSKGQQVDIVAPGDDILSTYPPNTFARLNGTSMAAPFVAGVAALAISKHRQYGGGTPLETQQDLIEHLRGTAIDIEEAGFDFFAGFGLINPEKLLNTMPTDSDKNTYS